MMAVSRLFLYGPSFRLKKGWEFDAVFRTGRQQKGELVRMFFLPKPEETTRVGVAVGKRIANAVERARGRRMLRESVRRLLPWVKEGHWIILSLREKALGKDAIAVYRDTARLFERAALLQNTWAGVNWFVDGN